MSQNARQGQVSISGVNSCLPFVSLLIGFVFAAAIRLADCQTSGDAFVSTCHLLLATLGLQTFTLRIQLSHAF